MVVDDQSDIRFLVRAYVEGRGVDVVAEADGLESALEQIDEAEPDVILLDARMPLIDGFEAAPLIFERRPGVRIVLLSALVDDQVREQAAAAGIHACLSKDQFGSVASTVREVAGAD
jgi:two-component system chemotaxis response regulator CheY